MAATYSCRDLLLPRPGRPIGDHDLRRAGHVRQRARRGLVGTFSFTVKTADALGNAA